MLALIPLWLVASWLLPTDDPLVHQKLAWLFVPYVVIAIGSAETPFLRRASRWGDLSYGIYLWGFLVQQILISQLGIVPPPVNIVLVAALTALAAFASWHLIEKRALRLRPRAPAAAP